MALYQVLEERLGAAKLFKDIEGGFRDGDDFPDELVRRVAECHVLLAVIGPKWLSSADTDGRRRLDNANDWVRIEIAAALSAKKRVIPVLVNKASPPSSEDLPKDIAALARKHARTLSNDHFLADAEVFSQGLARILDEIEASVEIERKRSKLQSLAIRLDKQRPIEKRQNSTNQDTSASVGSGNERHVPKAEIYFRKIKRALARPITLVATIVTLVVVVATIIISLTSFCDQLNSNSSMEDILKCQQP